LWKQDIHILIVEDEGMVQFLQQGLEEEGYQITSASDGLKKDLNLFRNSNLI
jgi:DNA-binding response OmpR family regulator